MQQHTIQLVQAVARDPQVRLAEPVTLGLGKGEHIALVGPNGSGKSLLVDLLTGRYPLMEGTPQYDFSPSPTATVYDNLRYIAFRDTYGSADGYYYYQQRWNQTEQDDVPLVCDLLSKGGWSVVKQLMKEYQTSNQTAHGKQEDMPEPNVACEPTDETEPKDAQKQKGKTMPTYDMQKMEDVRRLFDLFGMTPLLDKKVILLSSGELRKMQLTKALLASPRVLIMDNPFIGLDADTRQLLGRLLEELSHLPSLQIVLVLSMLDDIPPFITHVVPVKEKKVGEKMTRANYLEQWKAKEAESLATIEQSLVEVQQQVIDLPHHPNPFEGDEVVKLNEVSIRYEERTILKSLNWTVRRGEKWALSGDNGSGKSTLLSLVCADNPQSYACDIALFGRPRGSGESIWEIKKHIGYVSPEMHRAYLKNLPTIEIVASGLHDTIGLYLRPKAEELAICQQWMDIFGIGSLRDKPFLQLSSGEQRLALLARAFVKDPELLILDEPLHGLDTFNRLRVKRIIEAFCQRPDKTMIMVTHYACELPSSITHHLYLHRKGEDRR